MKEIRITSTVQLVTLLAAVAAIGVAVAAQLPELKRYMKIRSM
jgi:hypothetical protein